MATIAIPLLIILMAAPCILCGRFPHHPKNMDVDELVKLVNSPISKAFHNYTDKDGILYGCLINEFECRGREDICTKNIQRWRDTNAMKTKCPNETTRVKVITRRNVIELGGVSSFLNTYPNALEYGIKREHAVIVLSSTATPFSETSATFSIWKPKVSRIDAVYSLYQVWVTEKTQTETIEVGWHVYEEIYGDDNPRFFTFFTNDKYRSGCYDFDNCDGFTVLNKYAYSKMPSKANVVGGDEEYEGRIRIYMSGVGASRGWYVELNGHVIAFLRATKFNKLSHNSTVIHYGGEVGYYPSEGLDNQQFTMTEMGSGMYAAASWGRAAYINKIKVFDTNKALLTDSRLQLSTIRSKPNCYDLFGGAIHSDQDVGRYVFYGGPGGQISICKP